MTVLAVLLRAAWPPVAVVGVHSLLGGTIGHYSSLDPGFHFLGGLAGAYALASLWRAFPAGIRLPTGLTPSRAIVALTIGAALLWELGEYASDVFYGTHIQESVVDTVADVALGTLGALIGASLFVRPRPQKNLNE